MAMGVSVTNIYAASRPTPHGHAHGTFRPRSFLADGLFLRSCLDPRPSDRCYLLAAVQGEVDAVVKNAKRQHEIVGPRICFLTGEEARTCETWKGWVGQNCLDLWVGKYGLYDSG